MTQSLPFIMNGNGTISVMIEGSMKPVDTAHKNYEEIKTAIKEKNWEVIPDLINISKKVEEAVASSTTASGKITIKDGEVFYGATVIHNSLANRIISMSKEGFDVAHMLVFLENLMENPSYRAVNELYDFLEAGVIPITEKGTFLTYKKITENWKDIYTGKIDNSVGATVTMPRNMVNEDSNQTCSAGLHVCSYDYLPHFGSFGSNNRVVICEVNPRDVVSIPNDYNNTKMRVCEYKVIGEVEDYKDHNTLSTSSVVYTNDVTNGKTVGTVNHGPDNPVLESHKDIGKQVTQALYDCDFTSNELFESLDEYGVDIMTISEIYDIVEAGDYKRVGKKIAKLIANGSLEVQGFMAMTVSEEDEPERYEGECPECGAENRWELEEEQTCAKCDYENDEWLDWQYRQEEKEIMAPAIPTPMQTQDETERCDRCDSNLVGGSYECPECGYWNN